MRRIVARFKYGRRARTEGLRPWRAKDGRSPERPIEESVLEVPARPRAIVMIDEMPTTPVGKTFKPHLREIAAEEAAREALAAALSGAAFEAAARHDEMGLILKAKVSANAVDIARAELGKFPVRFEVVALQPRSPDHTQVRLRNFSSGLFTSSRANPSERRGVCNSFDHAPYLPSALSVIAVV
jgi:hypothetical protein